MMNENRCRRTVRALWISLAQTVAAPAVAQDNGDVEATAVSAPYCYAVPDLAYDAHL